MRLILFYLRLRTSSFYLKILWLYTFLTPICPAFIMQGWYLKGSQCCKTVESGMVNSSSWHINHNCCVFSGLLVARVKLFKSICASYLD